MIFAVMCKSCLLHFNSLYNNYYFSYQRSTQDFLRTLYYSLNDSLQRLTTCLWNAYHLLLKSFIQPYESINIHFISYNEYLTLTSTQTNIHYISLIYSGACCSINPIDKYYNSPSSYEFLSRLLSLLLPKDRWQEPINNQFYSQGLEVSTIKNSLDSFLKNPYSKLFITYL